MGATTLTVRLNMIAFLPMFGLGQAVCVLVGQRLGADRPDLAERTTYTGLRWMFDYMCLVAVVYLTLPGVLVSVFESESDPKHFAAHFQARPAASDSKAREYTGTVETYDCFRTGKPITLHLLVRTIPCHDGIQRAALVATSRLKDEDKIWPGLRHLLDDFKCGR